MDGQWSYTSITSNGMNQIRIKDWRWFDTRIIEDSSPLPNLNFRQQHLKTTVRVMASMIGSYRVVTFVNWSFIFREKTKPLSPMVLWHKLQIASLAPMSQPMRGKQIFGLEKSWRSWLHLLRREHSFSSYPLLIRPLPTPLVGDKFQEL